MNKFILLIGLFSIFSCATIPNILIENDRYSIETEILNLKRISEFSLNFTLYTCNDDSFLLYSNFDIRANNSSFVDHLLKNSIILTKNDTEKLISFIDELEQEIANSENVDYQIFSYSTIYNLNDEAYSQYMIALKYSNINYEDAITKFKIQYVKEHPSAGPFYNSNTKVIITLKNISKELDLADLLNIRNIIKNHLTTGST